MKTLNKYIPIDCGFYDRIELAIMRRKEVDLVLDDGESERRLRTRMLDTHQNSEGEYVQLLDGSLLRMDLIVSMDGVMAKGDSDGTCSIERRF